MDTSGNRQRTTLIFVAFFSLAMVGVFHTILGTALPAIRGSLGIDVIRGGLLGSAAWLGFTTVVFAGGALSDIFGRRWVLILACGMMGLSAILLGTVRTFSVNGFLLALIGAGTGMIVSTSSALVMGLYPKKEGVIMNVHHFFYALGAIAGPLAMGHSLRQGGNWEWIYRACGILMLILGGSLMLTKMEKRRQGRGQDEGSLVRIFREKNLFLLILITLFGLGTQNGVYFWLVSFLKEIRALPIFLSGLGLSLFSVGMATGRLLSGWLAARHGNTKVLLLLFITLNVALFLLLQIMQEFGILSICFILGIGCSGLFPGLLALGGINFPQWSGTTMGILGTAAGVGSTLMPWVMSVVSEGTSLKTGFCAAQGVGLIAFGLLMISFKRLRDSEREYMEGIHG